MNKKHYHIHLRKSEYWKEILLQSVLHWVGKSKRSGFLDSSKLPKLNQDKNQQPKQTHKKWGDWNRITSLLSRKFNGKMDSQLHSPRLLNNIYNQSFIHFSNNRNKTNIYSQRFLNFPKLLQCQYLSNTKIT